MCVCVRGRGQWGGVESGRKKEKPGFWVLSLPTFNIQIGVRTLTPQSRSRWHRSLLLSCSGRAWEKLASLGAAGALPAFSTISNAEGLGGELEGSKQE